MNVAKNRRAGLCAYCWERERAPRLAICRPCYKKLTNTSSEKVIDGIMEAVVADAHVIIEIRKEDDLRRLQARKGSKH